MLSLPRTRSLRIAEHTVHRCDPSDGDTEYVISTLKDFLLRVELCEHGVRVETHEPMPLNLSLVYESGKDVEQIGDVPLMTGADGLLDQGVAAFKLKVSALSSLRQQQRFRISIRVAGGEDAGLQVLTQPFRTLTKLYRAPARSAPAPPASAVGAGAASFTPDLLDDAERPVKRQPTEAEMQRLRGECDEIRNSMAELKSGAREDSGRAEPAQGERRRCQRAGLCAVCGQRAPSQPRVVDCRAVTPSASFRREASSEKPRVRSLD